MAEMKDRNFLTNITFQNSWKAFAILIAGIIITAWAAIYNDHEVEIHSKREFTLISNEITAKITARLHSHAQVLRSGSSFFSASDTVTRNQWKMFIENLRLNINLPGIQGVGFAIIIKKDQLKQHVQEIRNEGFPNYKIWPAGEREIYTSVIFLEPFSGRNLMAFGYDMFTEPVRRKALEQSRDFDLATLSGRVTLVQETDNDLQTGALMFVPVYRNGFPHGTVEQRRAAIVGWVYSPYRMYDLMHGILGRWDANENRRIHLQVYDNNSISSNSLLFDSQRNSAAVQNDSSSRTLIIPVEFNNTKWTLLFSQSKEPFYFSQNNIIVIISGVLISLLLFFLSLSLFTMRYRAGQIAKQLTTELQQSEERYRTITEWSPHAIIVHREGKMIYVNPAALKMFGAATTEEMLGKPIFDRIHPDSRPIVLSRVKIVLEKGSAAPMVKLKYFKFDGTIIDAEAQGTPIQFDGKPAVYAALHDITDFNSLKTATLELQKSEEKFQAIANYAASWEAWFNPEGKLVWMNSYSETLTGYTPEEYIAAKDYLSMVIAAEDIEMVLEKFQEALQGISGNDMETRINRKDGSKFWASVSWRPIFDLNGRSLGFRTSTKDISLRKKAEELLRESEEKHRILFMDSPDAYLIIIDGVIVDCNHATEVMLGGGRIRIIGQTPDALSPEFQPDGRKSTESALQKINDSLRTGKNSFEWVHQRFDGFYFTVEVSVASMMMGAKTALFTAWRDITDRKQAENEIKHNHERLLELNAEKDKFFSIIAHDLRGPFNGFLGLTKLMAEEAQDLNQDEIQKIARNMRDSATNLYGLLENLLEWARLQRGATPFEPGPFLLMPIISAIIPPVMDMANKKGIGIRYQIPNDLEVFADEYMLGSIFRNLASNAVKFTRKGGNVTIAAKSVSGSLVEISVKDTGIGMKSSMVDELFRLDVQTNRRGTEDEPSSGLGLLLCKDFIEKHGGRLWVESEEGKGSTFVSSQ